MKKQSNLNTILQKIVTDCYQQGCDYLGIIPYKKVIFKGFYNKKLLQEIITNEEIKINLQITNEKLFTRYVHDLPEETAGSTWPLNKESWITPNSSYENIADFLESLLHETAHAVYFNVNLEEGHSEQHKKLTKHLISYFHKNYNKKDLEKILENCHEN